MPTGGIVLYPMIEPLEARMRRFGSAILTSFPIDKARIGSNAVPLSAKPASQIAATSTFARAVTDAG
jgi:hypothetical protein